MPRISIVPVGNRYADLLDRHIALKGVGPFDPFKGGLLPPRQLEIQLSNNSGIACNLKCRTCQGQNLKPELSPMYKEVSSLIRNLNGQIPLIVISGMNTEPTLNLGLINLIELIKDTGASFGLHTNGVLLPYLEDKVKFISRDV